MHKGDKPCSYWIHVISQSIHVCIWIPPTYFLLMCLKSSLTVSFFKVRLSVWGFPIFWSIWKCGFFLTNISHVKDYPRKRHSRCIRYHLSPEKVSGKSQLATVLWYETESFISFSLWIFNRLTKITLDIFIQVNVQPLKSFWRSESVHNSSKFLMPAVQKNIFLVTSDLHTFTECFSVIELEEKMFHYFFIVYYFLIYLF